MSDDNMLQRKKDALWEVYQAKQHATRLKHKITVLLTSASKAARGWDERHLWVNEGREHDCQLRRQLPGRGY